MGNSPDRDDEGVRVSKQAGNSATVGYCGEWLLRPKDRGGGGGVLKVGAFAVESDLRTASLGRRGSQRGRRDDWAAPPGAGGYGEWKRQ